MQSIQPRRSQRWARAACVLVTAFGLLAVPQQAGAEAFYSVATTVEIELSGVPLDSGLIQIVDYWDDGFENFNGEDPPVFPSFVVPERSASGDTATASATAWSASTGAARFTGGGDAAVVNGRTASGAGFTLVNETDLGFFVDVTVRGFFEFTMSVDEGLAEVANTHVMMQFVGDALGGMPEDGLIGFHNASTRPGGTAVAGPAFFDFVSSSQILGFEETYSILIPPTFTVDGSVITIAPVSLGVAGVAQGRAISLYEDGNNFLVYDNDDPEPDFTLLLPDEIGPPIPEPGVGALLLGALVVTMRRR